MLAVTAMHGQDFVELGLMTATTTLEHFTWQRLVVGGVLTEAEYTRREPYQNRRLYPADRLRMVLDEAGIDTSLDSVIQPAISRYVAGQPLFRGLPLDGPEVVCRVRNSIVHPKGSQDTYQYEGLVFEVSNLARHYLVLLILHSIDYRGTYRNLTKYAGWVGDVMPVPWA